VGFKADLKKEIENIKKDVQKEVKQSWILHYEGHEIKVENDLYDEKLSIDGKIVDQKTRKSLLQQFKPFVTLKGNLQLQSGERKRVVAKLGGLTKLNCIIKIDGKKVMHEKIELRMIPWENKQAIAEFIEQQVAEHGRIVTDKLPDDEYEYAQGEEGLAPGLGDFMREEVTPFYVKALVKRLMTQLDTPTEETRKKTYELVLEEYVASYGSDLIEVLEASMIDEKALQEEALWFLEKGAHREIVKFGLTLIGMTNCEAYREKILTLGLHEEFTPYAIYALTEGTEYANDDIFKIAKLTKGWGKLAALHALNVTSEDMRDWLITEGYKNAIEEDFLAFTIANLAELDTLLERDHISREVYRGAAEIIRLLISTESEENIDAYLYANRALIAFIKQAKTWANTEEDRVVLEHIYNFLTEEDEVWEDRYEQNWKPFEREQLLTEIKKLLQK